MDVPLVTIIVEDEWICIADATAIFKTAPNFSRSSWDWIGLYKVKKMIFYMTLCSSVTRYVGVLSEMSIGSRLCE